MPDEDHGKGHVGVDPDGKAITSKTFKAVGEAFNQSELVSKENTYKLIEDADL
ncbi:hypothetical protein AMET1_0261 [Methanonatronarchaeum thermophilum]|uniref:Uncharacterized protein n=2 Tax=Methanonatronarchaeum thermophilum TaxID=1927129 RepID=A0A1Y3GGQ1_9EURY|nr:hypothetical protein AMET1_0261 [Methanonatronarchaeum thermophilum]